MRLLKYISNEDERVHFQKFIADILSRYPCLQNSKTFSRGLCNPRIKRVELRTLVRWIHAVIDAWNFRIYMYLGHSDYYYCSWKVGSQLSSDIENLGSALSREVKKHNFDTRVVIRRNCNETSLSRRHPVYIRFFLNEIHLKFLKNGWIAIANHRSSL